MSRNSKTDTGDGIPYSEPEIEHLVGAIDRADAAWGSGAHPTGIDVRAQIEWSGSYMRANNGVRRTHLDGLNLARVRVAVRRARTAPERVRRSYNAKSMSARLRKLLSTDAGRKALKDAGLPGSTLRAAKAHYFKGAPRTPSKKTKERITAAYEAMRGAPMDQEPLTRREAIEVVATELQEVFRDRYGTDIRFRAITRFTFE